MKNKKITSKLLASIVTMVLALTIVGNTTASAVSPYGQSGFNRPYSPQAGFGQLLPGALAKKAKKVKAQESEYLTNVQNATTQSNFILENGNLKYEGQQSLPVRFNWDSSLGQVPEVDVVAKLGCKEIYDEGICKVELKSKYLGNPDEVERALQPDILSILFGRDPTPIEYEALSPILYAQTDSISIYGNVLYEWGGQYIELLPSLSKINVRNESEATAGYQDGEYVVKGKFDPIPQEFPVNIDSELYIQQLQTILDNQYNYPWVISHDFDQALNRECVFEEGGYYPTEVPCYKVVRSPILTFIPFGLRPAGVDDNDWSQRYFGSLSFDGIQTDEYWLNELAAYTSPFQDIEVSLEQFAKINEEDFAGRYETSEGYRIIFNNNFPYATTNKKYQANINSSDEINFQDGLRSQTFYPDNHIIINELPEGFTSIMSNHISSIRGDHSGVNERGATNVYGPGEWYISTNPLLGSEDNNIPPFFELYDNQDVSVTYSMNGSYTRNWNPYEDPWIDNGEYYTPHDSGYHHDIDMNVARGSEVPYCDTAGYPYFNHVEDWACAEDRNTYCEDNSWDYTCQYCAYYNDPRCITCTEDSSPEECGCLIYGEGWSYECILQFEANPNDQWFNPSICVTNPWDYLECWESNAAFCEANPYSYLCLYCAYYDDPRCSELVCPVDSTNPECTCFTSSYKNDECWDYCYLPENAEDTMCNPNVCATYDAEYTWICWDDHDLFCSMYGGGKRPNKICLYCSAYPEDPRCAESCNPESTDPECSCFVDKDSEACWEYCNDPATSDDPFCTF